MVYYIQSTINLDKHTKKILKTCGIIDINNNVPPLNKYILNNNSLYWHTKSRDPEISLSILLPQELMIIF